MPSHIYTATLNIGRIGFDRKTIGSLAVKVSGTVVGRPMKQSGVPIYQIKVTLRHVSPPVWRRIEVPGDTTLDTLHDVLQIVMGWTDSHLHAFCAGGVTYGMPDPEAGFRDDMKDERNVRLDRIADKGGTLVYEYDFGDGWEHELKIEKRTSAEKSQNYAICRAGKRACPPEDCGGPLGYTQLLDALRDPKHEEHEDMLEWMGDDFDPEAFDLDEINRELRRLL